MRPILGQKLVPWNKSFSWNNVISCVFYERKNIFYGKSSEFTKNNTFNNLFSDRIFPYYCFLPILQKLFDFHKSYLIFPGKIFSTTQVFRILNVKFSVAKIVKRIFKHFWKITKFKDFLLIFEIEISRVIENFFLEKINHDL